MGTVKLRQTDKNIILVLSISLSLMACSRHSFQPSLSEAQIPLTVAPIDANIPTETPADVAQSQPDPAPSTSVDYKMVSQAADVDTGGKVDILFVDDNSFSMIDVQDGMAQRMSSFINAIQGLDYNIAVTTTDAVSPIWGDGRLLELNGLSGQYVINSSMNPVLAQGVLGATLQRSETGDPSEQGIYATYRAIERYLGAGNPAHKSFFRDDAALAVVVISDENETGNGFRNQPQNLVNLVKSAWPQKRFIFHSIVVPPGEANCKKQNLDRSYGTTYIQLSRMTGSELLGEPIIGSVCEADFGSRLSSLGESVQTMTKAIELECEPIGSSQDKVEIHVDGSSALSIPYEVQGKRIVFKSALPKGKYDLKYKCKKDEFLLMAESS